ncbi:MAG TPA: DUF1028 domain-containing protein [Candidatus Saccharimonadales bacterium]|nr:DUF1028 domain-containing protein [Candidatus Saccharimonadales bacterium]
MPRFHRRVLAAAAAVLIVTCRPAVASPPASLDSAPAAFTIVAHDSLRGEWGVAAVSRWIAVGARSLEARAGAGAWCALELPDPREAARVLDLLARGTPARAALDSLVGTDERRGERQIAIVGKAGDVAALTGDRCPPWSGQRFGRGYVCQGVALRDAAPIAAMAQAFEAARGTLSERLLAAIEAAESIFPVRDQVESAALLVVREGGGLNGWSDRLVDLRVDSAADAVPALKSLYAAHAATFLPAAYARFGDEAKRLGDPVSAEREYTRAEEGFRAAVARRPKDADARNELAWFLAVHDRDLSDAVLEAKAAVALRSNDPILYDTLAEAEYRSGSLARAIEAMERAVKASGGGARYVERLRRWTRERETLEGKGIKP